MHDTLNLVRLAGAMARHAGSRQAVVAQNIAHADTPGYRARMVPSFRDSVALAPDGGLRRTRAGHMAAPPGGPEARPRERPGPVSPNGNSVSLETEMLAAVEAGREHKRALTIYRHTLDVLRLSIRSR